MKRTLRLMYQFRPAVLTVPPPGDTVCGGELIVEIDRADTAGDLPRTPAASRQREWIERHNAAVSGGGGIIGVSFTCQNPTCLGITAVEFHAGQSGQVATINLV